MEQDLRLGTLAIHGGTPAFPAGPPQWPLPHEQIRAALLAAYDDGSWGRYLGPHVRRLEQSLADHHRVPHALTCASGTFAVELALRALQIGSGDEVVLAGYDFPGNFRAIESVGARPVLVDIDPDTWCLDAAALDKAVSSETRAVVVSHLHGGLADMPAICEFAASAGLAVVEDACQAPAAEIAGRIAGSWGDVGVLSFGGSKLLTAGRGGAILTSQPECHQRAKIFCERGNHAFPLSELQAAVLVPQLELLAQRNAARRASAGRLREACRAAAFLRPLTNRGAGAACYYKLAWSFEPDDRVSTTRADFLAALQAEGIALDAGFRGFTRRGPRRCRRAGSLRYSEQAAEATILLHHPILLADEATLDRLASAILKVSDQLVPP